MAKRLKAAALHTMPGPHLHARRAHVIALAKTTRLPVMYEWPESVREGGLIGYGPDNEAVWRQATRMVWRVANGTPPKDMPAENPMRIMLAINLATARALDLRVPTALLSRAEEVVV